MGALSEQEHWVVVLAEAEGLRWVLQESRMAWTAGSARRAGLIRPGDRLLLYVSRGAFHNPTRDESQLVGVAEVASPVARLRKPLAMAKREFVCACSLRFEVTLPEREGVNIRSLVERLTLVRRKEVWGQYFRSGLVQVSARDFKIMADAVRRRARELGVTGK
jgi:hypothetical protein